MKPRQGIYDMATSTLRVQQHRDNARNQGYRLVQLRVRDTRAEEFKAECRRQSLSLRNDPKEKEILDWMEQAQDYSGWDS
jgi:thiamine monophosphate synthase